MPAIRYVFDQLNDTAAVTGSLGTYDFGDGAEPAIFSGDVPDESPRIALILEASGGQDTGSNDVDMFWQLVQITVANNKKQSDKVVRDLAMAVRAALHKQRLSARAGSSYGKASCKCSLPVRITDGNGFPGYVLQVEVLLASS